MPGLICMTPCWSCCMAGSAAKSMTIRLSCGSKPPCAALTAAIPSPDAAAIPNPALDYDLSIAAVLIFAIVLYLVLSQPPRPAPPPTATSPDFASPRG
jgi:hypothetical protein